MDKIYVNAAGLDHHAIHHQVIWCGKSVCAQYVPNTNSGQLWANIVLH